MSTAFYPLGMKSYNNHTNQGGYKTWKGSGVYSNPVGMTAGNIRPFTNNDIRNIAIYKQGSARPIKQYRRGTSTPIYQLINNPKNSYEKSINMEANYYSNNQVKSSVSDKIIGQMIDRPGEFSIKQNSFYKDNSLNNECNTCNGVGIISNWAPITNLTEKPQPTTENPYLCCNAQQKARRRAIYANTNLKKNYYTTTGQYLYNRCQTFEQKSFNYLTGVTNPELYKKEVIDNQAVTESDIKYSKPGGPLSVLNTYAGNCNPNILISESININIINEITYILNNEGVITLSEYELFKSLNITKIKDLIYFLNNYIAEIEQKPALEFAYMVLNSENNNNKNGLLEGPSNLNGCKAVIYKPSNSTFAHEGAVTGSARLLQLNVQTIDKNIANIRALKGDNAASVNERNNGKMPFAPLIYKNKAPGCNPAYFTKNGNPKTCFKKSDDTTTIL